MPAVTHFLFVCIGPDCGDVRGSVALVEALRREVEAAALPVEIYESACFGQCRSGPNVVVRELVAGEDPWMARMLPLFGKGVVMHHRVKLSDALDLVARLRRDSLRR